MVRVRTRRARVIAVTSGKGGVGKSTFALNLAVSAARHYGRVTLVDADLGLANLDVMCGVSPKMGLADVLRKGRELSEVTVKTPHGVDLIPGASGIAYLADLPDEDRVRFLTLLETVERDTDLLIIDTGAGISRNVIRIAAAADDCFVVTTPEPTSITDAYAAIKLVSRCGGHGALRLVVNQTSSPGEARQVAGRIASVSRRFLGVKVEQAGHVLFDQKASRAVVARRPLVSAFPGSPAAICISTIARRLKGAAGGRASGGFVGRLKRLFGG
jgi:flagellar biosynthesis protein FlhG